MNGGTVRLTDPTTLHGGAGGDGNFVDGCDGIPTYAPSGTVDSSQHPDLFLAVAPLLTGGVSTSLDIVGKPGTKVYLLTSAEPHWRVLPPSTGVLHLLNPLSVTPLGAIPGSGTLSFPYGSPPPANEDEFTSLQFQLYAVENGARYLSNPVRSVVVHPNL